MDWGRKHDAVLPAKFDMCSKVRGHGCMPCCSSSFRATELGSEIECLKGCKCSGLHQVKQQAASLQPNVTDDTLITCLGGQTQGGSC